MIFPEVTSVTIAAAAAVHPYVEDPRGDVGGVVYLVHVETEIL